MKRYPAYNGTTPFWLGPMPSHWQRKSIRAISKQVVERNQPYLPLLSVYRDYGVILKDSRDDNHNRAGEDLTQYKVVHPGQLVLNKMKAWQGSVGVSGYDGIVSPAYITCDLDTAQNPRYIHLLLRSQPYIVAYNQISYGVRVDQWDMRYEDFKQLPVYLPSLEEQDAIVAFLDRKLAEIDRFIAAKQQLIALLQEQQAAIINRAVTRGLDPDAPMKPSGIEWLGDVPAHWEVVRTKFVAKLESGHTPSRQHPEYWIDCTIPWMSLADVWQLRDDHSEYVDDTNEYVSQFGIANSSARLLPAGTVILSRTASVGFSGIMGRPMATTQDFANWVCGPRILPEYLLYVFRSMRTEFRRLIMGSTHQTIYMPDIAQFVTPLPPRNEQNTIVQFIRNEVSKIQAATSQAEREIELIKEYRATLISDAVTGKIDVRAEVAEGVRA